MRPCLGYVAVDPDGLLLVDTEVGSHPEVDSHCRPRRISLERALARSGASPSDVRCVVNCHLHFDHYGGNPELTRRPIFTQRRELEEAGTPDCTLPELVDAPGLTYEVLEGEAKISITSSSCRHRATERATNRRPPAGQDGDRATRRCPSSGLTRKVRVAGDVVGAASMIVSTTPRSESRRQQGGDFGSPCG